MAPVTAPQPTAPPAGDLRLWPAGAVHEQLSAAALIEQALVRDEAQLTDRGALVAYTGVHTGRSPKDRYVVREPGSEADVDWGTVNRPMEPAAFDRLLERTRTYLQGQG